jgi:hypothetical protein
MYEVSFSGRVIDALRDLVLRNPARAPQLLAALREIERRLRIYPQFGQPLRDLVADPAQLWIGVVPPFVIHYILDEAERRVMVALPLKLLPHTGVA